MLWYRIPTLRTGDQRQFLDGLAAAAHHAVELEPRNAHAWDALGNAHLFRGFYESQHGGEPAPSWDKALVEIERALAIEPSDPWANNDLGVVHRCRGTLLDEAGRDPMPEYTAAIASYVRAANLDSQYVEAIGNIVAVEVAVAQHRLAHGLDPSEAVNAAIQAGQRCLAIDGSYYLALNNIADAELVDARYRIAAGQDPSFAITAARAIVDRWLRLQPQHMAAHYLRAVAAAEEARYRLRTGDATAMLADGHAEIMEALRLASDSADAYAELAQIDLLDATAAEKNGRPASEPLKKALAAARRAVALDGKYADAQVGAAEACWRLAVVTHGAADATVRDGLAFADAALALNPQLAEAHVVRAALLARRAALVSDNATRDALAAEAKASADRGFAINPLLRREWEERVRSESR
jgi:serine/threonine-protein kinase